MSITFSVADVLVLQSLPVVERARAMALVRAAFFAGFAAAVECADSDIALGMDWRHVPEYRVSTAGLWLTSEAEPLLGVDVGCAIDTTYSPTHQTPNEFPTPLTTTEAER